MRISTNILSLSAQRALSTTSRALARAMERLASGSRINSARDDAAGLAIAGGLEAQRRGLLQTVRNMNDARGFLDTADGAMAVQTDIVQRLRELAIQAANGTLAANDRRMLDQEAQQLIAEFDRIATQTQFNGVNLLDGTFSTQSLQVGTQKGQAIDIGMTNMRSTKVFTTTSTVTTSATSATGLGTFAARTTLGLTSGVWASKSLAVGDVSGDGVNDIVTGDYDQLSILIGNGNGTFQSPLMPQSWGQPVQIQLADVNGDSKLDLVSSDSSNGYITYGLGNGNGTFQSPRFLVSPVNLSGFDIADINGDSKMDIVADGGNNLETSIWLGNGNGTFQARKSTPATDTGGNELELRDMNGDSKLDIIRVSNAWIDVSLGNGNGTFQARKTVIDINLIRDLSVGDFNGDSKLDIVYVDGYGLGNRLLGNGNGTFAASTTFAFVNSDPIQIKVADLNGDSRLDIYGTDGTDNFVSVVFGNGNGTFQARITYASGAWPNDVMAADVTGDSIIDLVSTDHTDKTVSIFRQNTSSASSATSVTSIVPATISLLTQSSAQDALDYLDDGLTYIASSRATIGAVQSRLDFAQSNALNLIENISSAKSQLMDADYAQEMAEFTRLQILQQAGVSVFAQANSNSRLALDLLRNL